MKKLILLACLTLSLPALSNTDLLGTITAKPLEKTVQPSTYWQDIENTLTEHQDTRLIYSGDHQGNQLVYYDVIPNPMTGWKINNQIADLSETGKPHAHLSKLVKRYSKISVLNTKELVLLEQSDSFFLHQGHGMSQYYGCYDIEDLIYSVNLANWPSLLMAVVSTGNKGNLAIDTSVYHFYDESYAKSFDIKIQNTDFSKGHGSKPYQYVMVHSGMEPGLIELVKLFMLPKPQDQEVKPSSAKDRQYELLIWRKRFESEKHGTDFEFGEVSQNFAKVDYRQGQFKQSVLADSAALQLVKQFDIQWIEGFPTDDRCKSMWKGWAYPTKLRISEKD
jgi:hypothetical protein